VTDLSLILRFSLTQKNCNLSKKKFVTLLSY
jgi:hypothetical protein